MDLNKLLILNGCEKPCAKLVCREYPNGTIKYVNKEFRNRHGNMKKGKESASLAEFGFVNIAKNKFKLFFRKEDSIAKYSDGEPRYWQGKLEFTYSEIVNMNHFD